MALTTHGFHRCTILFLVLLVFAQLLCSSALECHCSDCTTPISEVLVACHTTGSCYTRVSQSTSTRQVSGCLSEKMSAQLCDQSDSKFTCCYENHCNIIEAGGRNLRGVSERDLRGVSDTNSSLMMITANETSTDNPLRDVAIYTVIASVVAMTIIISLTIAAVCCIYYRRRKQKMERRRNTHDEVVQSDFRTSTSSYGAPDLCQAFLPPSESVSSLLKATMFYGNALSLLVQRTIVQQAVLEKAIGEGHFCEMYIGRWRRERVFVKVYGSKKEKMWFNETEILQLPHMRHENILTFIAADIMQRNSQNYHYLISECHPRGTLKEYLVKTTIEVPTMVTMVKSMFSGLAYLHSEVQRQSGAGSTFKPSIAHGNISSRSVYVDEYDCCCLGDFSLSTKDDRHTQFKYTPLGEVRYLPPELLVDQAVLVDFEDLKKADLYSMSLVMWEMAQRCLVQGVVEEYELPYSRLLTSSENSTPTVVEMRTIVCERQERPPTADQWNRDQSTRIIVRTMRECWAHSPSDRPCSLKVKNSLDCQILSDKQYAVTVDKNGQVSHKQTSDPVQLYC